MMDIILRINIEMCIRDRGSIGLEAIIAIINHPKLCHLPFCLETPNELDGYAKEIALLREHYKY